MAQIPATLRPAPLSGTARPRRNRNHPRDAWLRRALRYLWATRDRRRVQATCYQCGDSMPESCLSGFERVCDRCVFDDNRGQASGAASEHGGSAASANSQVFLRQIPRSSQSICGQLSDAPHDEVLASRVEDAGAVMALRALLQELEFCLIGAGRLSELLRADAVLYTADILLGWQTPQSLRGPHYIKLDEQAVRDHLRRFDDAWGLRTGGTSLIGLYDGWRKLRDKQQAYGKLEQTDRSYAQLLREQVR